MKLSEDLMRLKGLGRKTTLTRFELERLADRAKALEGDLVRSRDLASVCGAWSPAGLNSEPAPFMCSLREGHGGPAHFEESSGTAWAKEG